MKNTTQQQDAIIVNNQEAAFCQLLKTHQSRLYRFVRKHVSNPDDAADIAQLALTEAYRSLANFRGQSQLSTWIYGIALNLIRGHIMRSPQHLHHFESEEILLEMAGHETDPNTQTSLNETMSAVQIQLDYLPNEMRDVLEMVTVDEMSYEEVAESLHIPVGTVRSRLFRARAQLKTGLINAGVEAF